MSAEKTLELFESVARPALNEFSRNTCIEQSRILIEVLARFGIAAEPLATKYHVVCAQCECQFFSSGDPVDRKNAQALTKGLRYRHSDRPDEVFGYHTVVLVERRLVADPTFAQAHMPEFGFHLKPELVVIPLPGPLEPDTLPDIDIEGLNDDNVPFTARWIGVPDNDWEGTPAWEPSHLWGLIDILEAHMRLEMVKQRNGVKV